MDLLTQLEAGLLVLGEDPESHPCEVYLAYIRLLEKWNKTYNLSGIKDLPTMLTHHLLDSLSILPFLKAGTALDVGSGAGLPGFLLALARPQMHWVLLDSSEKKTRFLQQARLELGPGNIDVVCTRIEDYVAQSGFANIVCRALMPAAAFCLQTQHLLAAEGQLLLMKGPALEQEIAAIDDRLFTVHTQQLQVPGLDAERYLARVERQYACI